MTNKVVVLVTAATRWESRRIASHLVEKRLAACVNITPPIESIYRWEGKIADEKEFLLVIKSTQEIFPELRAEILKIHSYSTPEILCLPVADGSPAYLDWVTASVKSPQRTE